MERLINRSQQGDLGEASAMEWLARAGARVSIPIGHSPDYDLIAEIEGRLIRIQVKTTTYRRVNPAGEKRWNVSIKTHGGNRSWNGVAKRFDFTKVDALFVLVGDGRRWLIPACATEATSDLKLGGRKYSEFELESAEPIMTHVYGNPAANDEASRIEPSARGSAGVWRAGRDCKSRASLLSGFDSHLPHPNAPPQDEKVDRVPQGRPGQAIIRSKRQMTLPLVPFTDAGLQVGDRLRFRAQEVGRVSIERIEPPPG